MPFHLGVWKPRPTTAQKVQANPNSMLFMRAWSDSEDDAEVRSDMIVNTCLAAQQAHLPIKNMVIAVWMGHERSGIGASHSKRLLTLVRKKLKTEGVKAEVSEIFGCFDPTGQLLNMGLVYAAQRGNDGFFSVSPAVADYLTENVGDAFIEAVAKASLAVGVILPRDESFLGSGMLVNSFAYYNLQGLGGAGNMKAWTGNREIDGSGNLGINQGAEGALANLLMAELHGPCIMQIDATKMSEHFSEPVSKDGIRYSTEVRDTRSDRYNAQLPSGGASMLAERQLPSIVLH